jgi:hypothetical protein
MLKSAPLHHASNNRNSMYLMDLSRT